MQLVCTKQLTVGAHQGARHDHRSATGSHESLTNDELHPLVYRSIIGLTIWLVLSVWVLFSRGEYEGLTLSVITLFFVILVGIPVLLWLTWRSNVDPNERHGYVAPFAEWTSHPFESWTGQR